MRARFAPPPLAPGAGDEETADPHLRHLPREFPPPRPRPSAVAFAGEDEGEDEVPVSGAASPDAPRPPVVPGGCGRGVVAAFVLVLNLLCPHRPWRATQTRDHGRNR